MMMGGGDGAGGTATNQFIGSKISLISKSEIRYEGILYSLDLEEATISLSKVRSFGTEDRQTQRPVGPKDEVYEFIIFRGADIKGIDVLEPPPPSAKEPEDDVVDPAIVEVQHYQPQQGGQQQQGGSSSREPGPIGPIPGSDHPINQHGMRNTFPNNYAVIPGPSNTTIIPNNTTPFSLGVGFGAPPGPIPNSQPIINNASSAQPVPQQQQVQQGVGSQQQGMVGGSMQGSQEGEDGKGRGGMQQQARRAYAPRGRGGGGGDRGGGNSPGVSNTRGGGPPQNNYRGNPRGGGGYYNNYGGNRYGTPGNQRNYFRRGELKGNKKITFEGEFDFEKANEELQKALTKIKIVDGEKIKRENEIDEHEVENASEDGEEEVGNKENDTKTFYQKDNFFDSISCEALERKAGKREKPDWRAERKLNAETFGLPQRGRGGGSSSTYYRGGGGYHNNYNNYNGYNRGGYYRGGGGGDRGGGSYRGGGYQQRGGGGGRGGYRTNNQDRRPPPLPQTNKD
ncbi:unnamed protein product [Orchesella dallaii]|uniref:Uncharacterized protein n=1 Tax=Orchesella dallaii TaxID=48710 RepID=A0ABP1PKI1_9HEXA